MFRSAIKFKNLILNKLFFAGASTGLLIAACSGFVWAQDAVEIPTTDSLDAGFRHMYNLDFRAAHRIFENWQHSHPLDPRGAAANAAAYLFGEFDRLHILEIELFTDEDKLKDRGKIKPDMEIKAAFESELTKAQRLASEILAELPDNTHALFALMLVDGLRADYAALIEKKNGDGLDFIKASRITAEKLLSLDPTYHDAHLAIGLENYLTGVRSAPVRWLLRMSGAQTNKNKGIESLRITAEKGRYLAPYARILLAISAVREKNPRMAIEQLAILVREFPQNRLYRAELARVQK